MKKIIVALCSVLFVTSFSFGFEWGGNFINDTAFVGHDDLKLKQVDGVSLWFSTPMTKDKSVSFSAQGSYFFKIDETPDEEDEFINVLNLDLFKLSINGKINEKNKYSVNAGRFFIRDISGFVFSQVCDGILLNFSSRVTDIQLYGGYTGLLNSKSVTILNSNETSYSEKDNDFWTLCPKYVPFGVSFVFPSLFLNQSLAVQGLGFKDLEKDVDDDWYDRYYGTIALNGFVSKAVSYDIVTVFGTENFNNLMNLSALHFSAFPNQIFFIRGGVTYASGSEGSLNPFVGFTSMKAALSVSEPQYSNLFKPDAKVSFFFGKKVLLDVAGAAFFVVDDDFSYYGMQFDGAVLVQIYSDMQLKFGFNQFIGDNSDESKTNVSVSFNLAF